MAVDTTSAAGGSGDMTDALRRVWRRLIGRDGIAMPEPRPLTRELDVHRKGVESMEAVEQARRAVDSFTASLDEAMRARPRRPPAAGRS